MKAKKCKFCNLDISKTENTLLYESDNFIVIPTLGSLVDGYVLVIPKKHYKSLSSLSNNDYMEYSKIIKFIVEKFQEVYGKTPIIFEHGTPKENENKANSISHAHAHIVNYIILNEKNLIKKYNFKKVSSIMEIDKDHNYIYYQNNSGQEYVTYKFNSKSQLFRYIISLELNQEKMYDWKKYKFMDNVEKTIDKIRII